MTASPLGARMADAAGDLLDALDTEQRAMATFPFTDWDERSDWHYIPRSAGGLRLEDVDARQARLVHRLLATGLTQHTFATACTVMSLESVLDLIEGYRGAHHRDPRHYRVTVFGEPDDERWGWRFEGHHVSVHATVAGDEVAGLTPVFLGANPARVQFLASDVVRPFHLEEEIARQLVEMLPAEARADAIVSDDAPTDILTGNLPSVRAGSPAGRIPGVDRADPPRDHAERFLLSSLRYNPEAPLGVAGGRLRAGERGTLELLLTIYVNRLPDGAPRPDPALLDRVHFAWAGSTKPGEPHYYRLQADDMLVEYDNTQDGANHVHTVYRDPRHDFGGDPLARHYATSHTEQPD